MLDPIIISYKLTIYLRVTYLEYNNTLWNTTYNKSIAIQELSSLVDLLAVQLLWTFLGKALQKIVYRNGYEGRIRLEVDKVFLVFLSNIFWDVVLLFPSYFTSVLLVNYAFLWSASERKMSSLLFYAKRHLMKL